MIGKTISHYRVTAKLGAGGMGEVYLAHDERLDREVALKVLPAKTLADEAARKRFRKEALALSRLNHPNIATVHDFDTQDGVDFLVMEYVEGETLSEKLSNGPLPEEEATKLGRQVADALEEAHEHGVIHRDLKPGNVMVTPKGQAKVLDFGLAKLVQPVSETALTESLTETPAAAGTLPYMAPEQLQGQEADARTDIYALGAVLYQMATGRRPFPEAQAPQLIAAIMNESPQPPSRLNSQVSAGLESIILKALEKDPQQRYQSSRELITDLERLGGPEPLLAARRRSATRRQLLATAAVAVVALLAVTFGLNLGGLRDRLLGTAAPARIESIAVLPLANLSGDPEEDYFADGMSEALITELGKIAALRVISLRSVMRYKGADTPLAEIARELNVDAVVEGSAQRVGQQAGITVRLIRAATDEQLWSEAYQRDLSNLLVLQSEVARAIAREIQVAVTPEEAWRLATARPVNPETYELYLKGMANLNKPSPEERKKGLTYLHQAVEKNPADALAYSGLAFGYATLGHSPVSPPDAWQRARAAALRAVKLDENLAEAHAVLADVKLYYEWDWKGAEQAFQRANELNPSLAMNHYHYAWYLFLFQRLDEAIVEHKRAQELDPLTPLHTLWLGELYRYEGQYEEAIAEARKGLELKPNAYVGYFVLGNTYAEKGMFEEAITAHRKMAAILPAMRWALGGTYALAGREGEARKILTELEKEEATPINILGLAALHSVLGEKDEAFRWLEAGYKNPHGWFPWLEWNPYFDPLRDDPRYRDLLRRMNLPE